MGNKIKELRLARAWTQEELAKRAGLIQNQLSNYERGKIDPTPSILKKIARALGVDPNILTQNPETPSVFVEKQEPELTDEYMNHVFDETLPLLDQKTRKFLLDFLQLLKWKMEIKKM